jgi:Tfp pilus assembly protein PilN
VDQQLTDERERLAMKKSIVAATKPLRTDLENTQRKITLIKNLFIKQETLTEQMEYITTVIPKKSIVSVLLIDEKKIEIEASTSDFRVIQLFIARLAKDARFEKVQMGKIQKLGNQQYSFSITLEGYKSKNEQSEVRG